MSVTSLDTRPVPRRASAGKAVLTGLFFAALLLPLEVMGLPFHFTAGEGPVIEQPVREAADVHALRTDRATQKTRPRDESEAEMIAMLGLLAEAVVKRAASQAANAPAATEEPES